MDGLWEFQSPSARKENSVRLFWFSTAHLLQFGESERVAVLGSELHEPHVGRVRELSDDAEAGEQPERDKERGMLEERWNALCWGEDPAWQW